MQYGGETFKVTPDAERPADYFLVEYRPSVAFDNDLLVAVSSEGKLLVFPVNVTGLAHGVVPVLPLKVAVTVRACVIDTVQVVPLALAQPLQFPNVEPLAAAAVSVTLVPLA